MSDGGDLREDLKLPDGDLGNQVSRMELSGHKLRISVLMEITYVRLITFAAEG